MSNLPNILTSIRILLVPILVVVLLTKFDGKEFVGLALFLIWAANGDIWADGAYAWNQDELSPAQISRIVAIHGIHSRAGVAVNGGP